jgi:hypothetical protein
MHVPATGLVYFSQLYPDAEAGAAAFLGTYRPIVIFRGKDFDKDKQRTVELLYGTSHLPKYNVDAAKWEIVPNKMGQKPKFGLAGMNNFFNNYTWTMQLHKGKLFVGTMDWLYLGGAIAESMGIEIPESVISLARARFDGADLRCFTSLDTPAVPVDLNGLGNYLNYGLRTMVSDDFLYIGTANPMNLATEPGKDNGGWELYRLYEKY